ncbi:MAG TPA: MauE/DoxX family redox-associated membrane protein [Paludibacter sp.]|nr:MauE/DoxX family redox-associated membrane protein [Paludibacter sp.]
MIKLSKILPFILGIIFITSGATKLISVDYFEQFLYSFGILKLNYTIILTRLIIGLELTLGLLFLLRIFTKPLSYITLGLLFVFTVFIVFLELSKSADDCYCFGTIIQLSNTVSIIKNIILAGLVIFLLRTYSEPSKKFKRIKLVAAVALGFGLGFGIYFPDMLLGIKKEVTYCKPCFNDVIKSNELSDKKVMICFLSTKCKYCQLAAKKVNVISQKAGNSDKVLFVLWDNDHNPDKFFQEIHINHFQTKEMDMLKFLKLTNGKMPLLILFDKGNIKRTFRYKDIDEDAILKFLKD